MANGTPSQSFKLGADLLEQLGDLQGAARALNDEAKDAKREVRDAEREYKNLEKSKASQIEIDKAFGRISTTGARVESLQDRRKELLERDKQRKADKAAIENISRNVASAKSDREKEEEKFKKEKDRSFQQGLNVIQRNTQSKINTVKDSIDNVSKVLLDPQRGATAQAAGRVLSRVSGGISSSGVTRAVAALGPVGLVVGASAAGAEIITGTGRKFLEKRTQVSQIKASVSTDVFDRLRSFAGKEIPQAERERLTTLQSTSRRKAAKITSQANLGIGGDSILGQLLNLDVDQARVEKLIAKNALRTSSVGERFGAEFAKRVDIENLAKTRTVRNEVRKEVVRRGWISQLLTGAARDIGSVSGGLIGGDSDVSIRRSLTKVFGLEQFEDIALQVSEGIALRTISDEAQERARIKQDAQRDPVQVAERHNRATRFLALEKQRIIRQQSWAAF